MGLSRDDIVILDSLLQRQLYLLSFELLAQFFGYQVTDVRVVLVLNGLALVSNLANTRDLSLYLLLIVR